MIRYLQIENFKSLKKAAIPLEKLNLFFGLNGMGKSSVIQVLLLLRQSYWSGRTRGLYGLYINGELIRLGTSTDILCQSAEEERLRFLVGFEADRKVDVDYPYFGNPLPTGVLKVGDLSASNVPFAEEEPLFSKGFCYLGAEHIGPRNEYRVPQLDHEGINFLGNNGEFAVPFLALQGDRFQVPVELCLTSGKTNRLFDQVSAWISELSPGVKISARYMPFEERAKLDISYSGRRLDSAPFLPVNVGFGIPYVLPLVIALLTTEKNGLLMIENPESHLHPKGQARMADLIARVASRGTQVICESHSDHIINGIRIAVKEEKLSCGDLSIIYFDKDEDQVTHTVEIAVDKNGNLSDYPEGFLDEWGIQMSALL